MTGGRPAATVIRASRPQQRKDAEEQSQQQQQQQEEEYKQSQAQEQPAPILKDVVERSQTQPNRRSENAKSGKLLSRFAQQQQQQAANGFPSVHLPIGTFVKNKTKTSSASASVPANTVEPPPAVKPSVAVSSNSTKQTNNNNNQSTNAEDPASMIDASRQDAQNMLHNMSLEEIQDQQQELTAALSPQLLAFLKQRGATQSTAKTKQTTASEKTTTRRQPRIPAPTTATVRPPPPTSRKDILLEKERLAKLVASVQTHQDLDAAYHAEMKEAHPLENETKEDANTNTSNKDDNDFAMACDLLRSTAPRQTLWAARVVQQRLQNYVQEGNTSQRDWPLVLPVSLRCLLDRPVSTGCVLHTFVLQSLYSLLLLTARSDHVVHVASDAPKSTAALVFADQFLDDAIPTPRLDTAYTSIAVQPLAVNVKDNTATVDPTATADPQQPAAAYSTSSSSTSAQSDGQAFEKDPMWTLLSKMRLLPRLAQLLMNYNSWPREAWMATCGILGMLAQRSPGAASAICHHATILPKLLDVTLKPLQQFSEEGEENEQDLEIAHAGLTLLCTMARQSRVTAQSVPISDILPALLARTATSALDHRLQQLALQLWRSMLRYGLGLEALSTVTTCAARHVALPYTTKYSLSTEFVSACAQVLECARVAAKATMAPSSSSPIPASAIATLSLVVTYLSSTQQQILPASTEKTNSDKDDECLRYRWNAARLRFLSSYWILSSETTTTTEKEEIKTEDWSMEQVLNCLEAMDVWTDPGGDVELAWKRVASFATSTNFGCDLLVDDKDNDMDCEAAACAFLESCSSLLLTLETSSHGNRMVRELSRSVVKRFSERILQGLSTTTSERASTAVFEPKEMPLAQRGWINQSHFAVSKFLFHCMSTGVLAASPDVHLVRMLVFSLVGRLERGNEAMAAVLFSQDGLFEPNSNPLKGDDSNSSPISSMFLGELCGSDRARTQLDHSFKLQHGFGISPEGFGAFALDSLLSDAEQPGSSDELVLPIGTLWLWQSLSGSIRMKEETVSKGTMEAANVVSAVLGLLLELEEGEALMGEGCLGYSARIPLGAKLYYLMNVCLHHEEVLRDDRVMDSAEAVLERYWHHLDQPSILDFCKACLRHVEPAKKGDSAENEDEQLEEEKAKKLLELFSPEAPNELALTSEEMRSLDAFLDDLSEAYNDYGAQYDFFTQCIRLFLLPVFPSMIRCRTLRELGSMFHLLTLPKEMEDEKEMSRLLLYSVAGGLPQKDGTSRDPPDVLDAATFMMIFGSTPRPLHGYMRNYAIALLVRNLATILSEGEGLDANKRRLLQLDANTIELVCEATSKFLSDAGTKQALVEATIKTESSFTAPNSTQKMEKHELDDRLNQIIK
jgi:hypothetical protein